MTHMLNNRRCFPLKLNHSYFHPVCSTEIKHAAFTTHGMSMNTSLFTLTALTDCQSLPHHTTVQLLPGNICEHIEKKKFSIWQFPALLSLKTCARNWTEHDIAMKDTGVSLQNATEQLLDWWTVLLFLCVFYWKI